MATTDNRHRSRLDGVAARPSPTLSPSQLTTPAELDEERSADARDVLYQVGDHGYPFIAIVEGDVAILDASGNDAMAVQFVPRAASEIATGRALLMNAHPDAAAQRGVARWRPRCG